jgi:hypothetical protein
LGVAACRAQDVGDVIKIESKISVALGELQSTGDLADVVGLAKFL